MTTFAQGAGLEVETAMFVLEPGGTIRAVPGVGGTADNQLVIHVTLAPDSPGALDTNGNNLPGTVVQTFNAEEADGTAGLHWFDGFHVIPRSIELGNLLTDQSIPLEVFSAFLTETRTWSAFVNNGGAGVTIVGLPGLPLAMGPLTGVQMTVEVSAVGEPFVDDTLDFSFTGLPDILVPIMVQRLVLWDAVPDMEFEEVLSFLTQVQKAKDGTEKRSRVRKSPRQAWTYSYQLEEGDEAQVYENLLFDFHARSFGVPVWDEASVLTADVSAGALTINVDSTDFRDYRVGGFAVVLTSRTVRDVLQIDSLTSTSITFVSALLNDHDAGVEVFPLAICITRNPVSARRYVTAVRQLEMLFLNTDNDVDLADLSAFSEYNGKLLIDGGNTMLSSTLESTHSNDGIVLIDGEIGRVVQSSPEDRNRRRYQLTLRARGREAKWNLRQAIHAIGGRQVSFYAPSDAPVLTLADTVTMGGTTIDVANVGYAQFVRHRQPKNVIRVRLMDGTEIVRMVLDSEAISATVDRLTVDSTWPVGFVPGDVDRIEYIEKVRFDEDNLRIRYTLGERAYLATHVKTVIE